ncbi:MAG: 30S ribosomal protein S4 [Mycoplasmataceae bacterium]|jgi:small subunit ribosomal protein S4|nr:30S ribosomal protein S4 [Mycoplasmataceae bacterium]
MRFTGSVNKKSRRLGFSILENNKEFSKGKKRTTAPGQHGKANSKLSSYGEHLREKQKVAYTYGVTDKQLRRIFTAAKKREGSNALNLLILLESRLDNLVYRIGLAPTRRAARQLVSHGHVLVDGKCIDIPSYVVAIGSEIELKLKNKPQFESKTAPSFVESNLDAAKGKYVRFPERSELNPDINEVYVIEYYNRLV